MSKKSSVNKEVLDNEIDGIVNNEPEFDEEELMEIAKLKTKPDRNKKQSTDNTDEVVSDDLFDDGEYGVNSLILNPLGQDKPFDKNMLKSGHTNDGGIHTYEEQEKDARTVAMETTIKELFSTKDLHMKTDINSAQIIPLAQASLFAEKYNCTPLATFVGLIEQLSISKERKGRGEMTSIIQQSSSGMIEDERSSSNIFERLLGK